MQSTLKYGKTEAQMIAGVAIVMMLVHHFFGFADYRLDGNWIYEPVKIGGVSVERILLLPVNFVWRYSPFQVAMQYGLTAKVLQDTNQ